MKYWSTKGIIILKVYVGNPCKCYTVLFNNVNFLNEQFMDIRIDWINNDPKNWSSLDMPKMFRLDLVLNGIILPLQEFID